MFVQIVKFTLKPNVPREMFLDLTSQMVAWLETRPGFVSYELYEAKAGWCDKIAWRDQACAQNGLTAFLSTDIAQRIVLMVEDGHSHFFGESVFAVSARNSV